MSRPQMDDREEQVSSDGQKQLWRMRWLIVGFFFSAATITSVATLYIIARASFISTVINILSLIFILASLVWPPLLAMGFAMYLFRWELEREKLNLSKQNRGLETPRSNQNYTLDVSGCGWDSKKDILDVDDIRLRRLRNALLVAFPTRQDLVIMVSYGLHENLSAITGDGNLEHTVFELIQWAVAKGRLEELVIGARKQNSQNPQLRSAAEFLRLEYD